jgi:hypothetical protein
VSLVPELEADVDSLPEGDRVTYRVQGLKADFGVIGRTQEKAQVTFYGAIAMRRFVAEVVADLVVRHGLAGKNILDCQIVETQKFVAVTVDCF